MDYTIIILGVVVIILLYVLYKYFSTNKSVISPLASLKNANAALPMPSTAGSANYSYNVWVFVNSWSNTNFKPIFSRIGGTGSAIMTASGAPTGATAAPPQIALYLDKTTPTLNCFIKTNPVSDSQTITITSNFPIQSWVYVTVSVQGQYVDLYLQGKLVKSIQLAKQAEVPSLDATVQLGTLSTYGVNVDLTSNGVAQNTFKLF